jgi:hypothetical protein
MVLRAQVGVVEGDVGQPSSSNTLTGNAARVMRKLPFNIIIMGTISECI